MSAEIRDSSTPKPPAFPVWAKACGWLAVALFIVGKSVLELGAWGALALGAVPAAAWITASVMQVKALKKYEVDELRWRIANGEGMVRYHEDALAEGEPWFDDQSHKDWEFDHKYQARKAQERLEELRDILEEKTGQENKEDPAG